MVTSTTTTWKNIYGLHKPSDFVVQVDDKDAKKDDVEEEVEIRDDELNDVVLDGEEEEQKCIGGSVL